MNFKDSETAKNLMRAFAGESQARNRYTFAKALAIKEKQYWIADVFDFTANQEKEHADIFYGHLKELNGETLFIDGGYPVEKYDSLLEVLKHAKHNEYEEYEDAYPKFSEIAKKEGYEKIAIDFLNIASIEKTHGDRFQMITNLIENQHLYNDNQTRWMCLNCGFIVEGQQAPMTCPVCLHEQGYFIRLKLAPFSE